MFRFSTHTMIITAALFSALSSCRKTEIKKEYVSVESYENLAQVTTPPLDSVSYNEAYGSCEVVSEGISPVTECGLCWDTDPQPLRLGTHIGTGEGKGITKGKIEGLRPSTKYYLRAYAKNGEGISYGNEITFTTSPGWSYHASNPGSSLLTELFFANGMFYALSSSGIYVSTDPAKTWNYAVSGSSSGCFAANGNKVYAATPTGLYDTNDNGQGWNYQYVGININDLLVTNALYISTISGVRKSLNGGQSWTPQNSGLSGTTNALASKGNGIYVGGSTGIYKSINSASSWTSVMEGIDVLKIEVSGANLLAGTTQGVYISKDDGATWTNTGILPNLPTRVYCFGQNAVAWSLSSNFVYVSSNEGLNWKKFMFDAYDKPITITSDGNYYYGSSSSGIFRLAVKF